MGNNNSKGKKLESIASESIKGPRVVPAEEEDVGELSPTQEFEPCPVPVDDEGFVQSFDTSQPHEYKAFFDKYGFVVVNNVISAQDCDASVDEIWTDLRYFARDLVNRDDADTWDFWPSQGAGILGDDVAKGPMAWKNRTNPNLYQVYATLIGTPHLLASVDRFGVMRPTKDVVINNKKEDKPKWRTRENWFHWDLNPWKWCHVRWEDKPEDPTIMEKLIKAWDNEGQSSIMLITENNENSNFQGFEKVQGLVAFADSHLDSGGFQTVPGYHNFVAQWAAQTRRYARGDFVNVKKEDKLVEHAQKISMRKGSLVVWSSRMPHCNYPNDSAGWRYNQYIKMFPAAVLPGGEEARSGRARAMRMRLPSAEESAAVGFQLDTLGEQILGLEPWPQDEEEKKTDKVEKEA